MPIFWHFWLTSDWKAFFWFSVRSKPNLQKNAFFPPFWGILGYFGVFWGGKEVVL